MRTASGQVALAGGCDERSSVGPRRHAARTARAICPLSAVAQLEPTPGVRNLHVTGPSKSQQINRSHVYTTNRGDAIAPKTPKRGRTHRHRSKLKQSPRATAAHANDLPDELKIQIVDCMLQKSCIVKVSKALISNKEWHAAFVAALASTTQCCLDVATDVGGAYDALNDIAGRGKAPRLRHVRCARRWALMLNRLNRSRVGTCLPGDGSIGLLSFGPPKVLQPLPCRTAAAMDDDDMPWIIDLFDELSVV